MDNRVYYLWLSLYTHFEGFDARSGMSIKGRTIYAYGELLLTLVCEGYIEEITDSNAFLL